jgi:hypothetical protein
MPIHSSFSAAQSPSYAAGFLNHAASWLPPLGQGLGEQAQSRHTVDQLLRVMMAFTLMQGATGEAGGLVPRQVCPLKLQQRMMLRSRFHCRNVCNALCLLHSFILSNQTPVRTSYPPNPAPTPPVLTSHFSNSLQIQTQMASR